MLLEVCAGSIQSALNAQIAGAQRIELCENLAQGGTTPSYGTIAQARDKLKLEIFVLIRPRPGDFLYTAEEFQVMKKDIEACKALGCDGVVLGLLLADGSIDQERTRELVELARPMQVTFHRAFDSCKNPVKGLEDVIASGCSRLLTSGQKPTVFQGLSLVKTLIERAGRRIIILPGSGINSGNIRSLKEQSGAAEFHASAKAALPSSMNYKNSELLDDMGDIYESNVSEIQAMLQAIR